MPFEYFKAPGLTQSVMTEACVELALFFDLLSSTCCKSGTHTPYTCVEPDREHSYFSSINFDIFQVILQSALTQRFF
jgi:hypothetical protein